MRREKGLPSVKGFVAGMSQATQLDSLSVGYTIRLYAAMIGYGYECMRTPL